MSGGVRDLVEEVLSGRVGNLEEQTKWTSRTFVEEEEN